MAHLLRRRLEGGPSLEVFLDLLQAAAGVFNVSPRVFGTGGDGCDSWTTNNAFSQSQTMQTVIFGTPGTVLAEAKAKDILGSSSTAVTQLEVLERTVAVSDDVTLHVVRR